MTILVDADACPVVKIIEQTAKLFSIPVTLFCDTNHVLTSSYATVKTIGAGADAVDIALANVCQKGDIVVSQDYGVAALALGKSAFAISQNGLIYSNENIDSLLFNRFAAKKERMSKTKNHLKGPKKRTAKDDKHFKTEFLKLIEQASKEKT